MGSSGKGRDFGAPFLIYWRFYSPLLKSCVFVILHPPENHLCPPDSSIRKQVSSQCVYDFKIISNTFYERRTAFTSMFSIAAIQDFSYFLVFTLWNPVAQSSALGLVRTSRSVTVQSLPRYFHLICRCRLTSEG